MAKKTTTTTSTGPTNNKKASTGAPAAASPTKKAPAAKAVGAGKSTEIRNTPVPKPSAVKAAAAAPTARTTGPVREISTEMIARRAYEIWASGTGGTEEQNWLRAERELRAGL